MYNEFNQSRHNRYGVTDTQMRANSLLSDKLVVGGVVDKGILEQISKQLSTYTDKAGQAIFSTYFDPISKKESVISTEQAQAIYKVHSMTLTAEKVGKVKSEHQNMTPVELNRKLMQTLNYEK